jgi:hypothetical protein
MTCCSQISFDSRLSDRNDPPGSDKSPINFQNSASDRRDGSPAGAGAGATGAGARGASAAGADAAGTAGGA